MKLMVDIAKSLFSSLITAIIFTLLCIVGYEFIVYLTSDNGFQFRMPESYVGWVLFLYWIIYPCFAFSECKIENPHWKKHRVSGVLFFLGGFVVADYFYPEQLAGIVVLGGIFCIVSLIASFNQPRKGESETEWKARLKKEKRELEDIEDSFSEMRGEAPYHANKRKLLYWWKFW
jgi:hypothetical protein